MKRESTHYSVLKYTYNLYFLFLLCDSHSLLFLEFLDAKVVYNIDSPTVGLDEVYFPSVAICNMNNLRRSFIKSLETDQIIQSKISKEIDLEDLIDDVFLSGKKYQLSETEEEIIECK